MKIKEQSEKRDKRRRSMLGMMGLFLERRMLGLLLLGFSSGLPLALSAGTLQAWLTISGLDIKLIGFFAWVGLPYTFKFVWAPLLDRFELWQPRKGWIIMTQLGLAVCCLAMAKIDPKSAPFTLGGLALLLAFLSASQDIVFDAYRTDLLPVNEQGVGVSVAIIGYRIAMMVSGGLAFILADQFIGWAGVYQLMAAMFVMLALAGAWLAPPVLKPTTSKSKGRQELWGFFVMVLMGAGAFFLLEQFPWPELSVFMHLALQTAKVTASFVVAIWAARWVGFPSFTLPWDTFFAKDGAKIFLCFIVLYKLGDAFANALSTTFLIRGAHFTPTEVGSVNKLLGILTEIAGSVAGGIILGRYSLYKSLMSFGFLQGFSNLGYWLLSVLPKSYFLMVGCLSIEHFTGGMGSAAFVAFLTSLTDRRFSASQYALLSALSAVGRVYVGPASGLLVESMGWPTFFLCTVAFSVPGLFFLWLMKNKISKVSHG